MNIHKTLDICAFLAGTLLLFSCSIHEEDAPLRQDRRNNISKQEVVITASLGDEAVSDTRTSLVTDEEGAPEAIYWTPGDQIKIFSAGESSLFTSINSTPAPVAKFKGEVSFITGADDGTEVDYVWGLYPYHEDAVYSEPQPGVSRTATITTYLLSDQAGKAGTFDEGYAITIGRSESLSIPFKTVYTLMRFTVSRNDIKSVTFKGNNNEPIAGRFTVGMDDSASPAAPIVRSIDTPETEITLSMADGCFEVGKLYYIVMLPTTFSSGFTFTLTRMDGKTGEFKLSTTSPVTLARNKFSNVSNLDKKVTSWTNSQPSNEIYFTVVDGTSNDVARNMFIEREWGEQIVSVYDQERGMWVATFDEPVVEIFDEAFYHNSTLKSISLPPSVSRIGQRAFAYSNLESISFGSDFCDVIGDVAFESCKLQSLAIPGTNFLGQRAFAYNTALTEVEFLGDVQFRCADGNQSYSNPFMGCKEITRFFGNESSITEDGKCLIDNGTLISYAPASTPSNLAYVIPDGVTSIGAQAMLGSQFQQVVLPQGLTSIGWAAIAECESLRTLTIPESVSYISGVAFAYNPSLVRINMAGATPPEIEDNIFSNINPDYVIAIPGAGTLTYDSSTYYPDWYALRDHFLYYQANNEIWYHLVGNEGTWITLGSTDFGSDLVSSKRTQLFGTTENLVPMVPIPSGLVASDESLEFTVYTFDGRLTKIPANAFSSESWNSKLDWISFPATITEIGTSAFKGCSNLLTFPIGSNYALTSVGDDAFNGCSSMVNSGRDSGQIITLSDNVKTIGARAFKGCSSMKLFSAKGVTSLGEEAFMGCTDLEMATIGPVTTINSMAFADCINLVLLRLTDPSALLNIGSYAFSHDNKLETIGNGISSGVVDLPNLTTIRFGAFSNCSSPKDYILPELTTIDNQGLYSGGAKTLTAPKLENLFVNALGSNPFESLDLPSIKFISANALSYSYNLKELKLGSGLESVSTNLFFNVDNDGPTNLKLYLSSNTPLESLYNSLYTSSGNRASIAAIYVPTASVNAYKIAWPDYSTVIQAMP